MPAYLDHAASSPVRPEAFEAMQAVLMGGHGNPSGAHGSARAARRLIDEAREVVATAVGAHPTEVVFTSGGTEADNLAVLGTVESSGGVAVCSAIEHHAVLDPVLGRGGVAAPVTPAGVVDLDALEALLVDLARHADGVDGADRRRGPVTLVSVMAVNNEVGTVQPIAEVVDVVRRRAPQALVHCDAVQAVSWLDGATLAAGCDLVSISAHKFGGPQGVGALVVRGDAAGRLVPRQIGGAQERALRPGTQNVVGIVGLGAALAATLGRRTDEVGRIAALRDRLASGLVAQVPGLVLTAAPGEPGPAGTRLDPDLVAAGICHVCIDGIESEPLLYLLDAEGIDASAASSCASGALVTSHVLDAMGVDPPRAAGSLRLSLGWSSTDADVDLALEVIPAAVDRLARFAEAP